MTRRTLVTGAGSGIGRSVARHLRSSGHWVAGIDRAWKERTVVDLAIDADLTDEAAVISALEEIGPLDAVVANAAVTDLEHRSVTELPIAEWRRIFDINVTATVHLVQNVVADMEDRSSGNIVIVTSSLGTWKGGIEGDAVYSASKAALEAFAYVLSLEVRDRAVNVNTVYPSVKVDTGFFEHLDSDQKRDLHPASVLDECIAFLANLPPGTVTGVSLDQQAWDDDPEYRRRLQAMEVSS